jgi:hypothetical protein
MAFTFLTAVGAQSANTTTATTAGIDTSGAGLLVVYTAADNGMDAVVTDSYGNTWSSAIDGSMAPDSRFFYCISPSVGTGHTFTVSDNLGNARLPSIAVLAFSVSGVAVFDQESRVQTNGTTAQPGSITPSEDNALVVQGITFVLGGGVPTIDGAYAIEYSAAYSASVANGIAAAYDIQTTAAATNPTWTFGSFAFSSCRSASFTEDAATPGLMGVRALTLAGLAPSLALTVPIPSGAIVFAGHGIPYDNFTIDVPTGSLLLTGLGTALEGVFEVPTGSLVLSGLAPLAAVITHAHLSQFAVEFAQPARAGGNLSQFAVEVIAGQSATARLSQLVVEVMHYTVAVPPEPCPTVHQFGCPVDLPVPLGAVPTGCPTDLPLEPTVAESD